ncbi:hypothetical protein LFX25_13145 [Leptospira sp. FAT2]|uniref:sigma factor SigX-regulated lipoprotein n=1 Tax=Leptospira sanjuanensis TaxID=2879643 RepID=UPI001EE839AE|nr:hypothetical protein [Leptospira sanjuanensis]MCG6194190.1 hypothetical protein [Leptospira sanjuanensis]
MFQKIFFTLTTVLLVIQCGGKGGDDSNEQAALLLALMPKDQGISGVYAILAKQNGGGGGGAGAYSKGNVSPFQAYSGTYPCPRGGSDTANGDITMGMAGGVFTATLTAIKHTYTACSFLAPRIDGSSQDSSLLVLNGDVLQSGTISQTMDPANTSTLIKVTQSGSYNLSSSNYTVNGYLYPKFDLTFSTNNSKLTIENANDLDKATVTVDETTHVTGTIGDKSIDTTYTLKTTFKMK